jgi:hypothetical protein
VRIKGRMPEREIDEDWSALFTLRDARIIRVRAFDSREGAFNAAALRD